MTMNRDALVAGGVAGAAFVASAQHIWSVTVAAGNPALIAALHPLAIDGLVYIGIRSVQRGNRGAGVFALVYGAGYSLAFNAASYGGFAMHWTAMAACLPIALVAAVLIVHGGRHAPVEPVVEPLEDVEPVHAVAVVEPVMMEPAPLVQPSVLQLTPDARPVVRASTGRVSWDVAKVVHLLQDGRDVPEDVASAKNVQRVRYIVRAIQDGAADASIVQPGNRSLALVQGVRSAMKETA